MTSEDTRHSVSVAGVVIDENGRALVIQRRDNACWEPPGGVLERDETITVGLLREVKEETGLLVETVTLTGVYKNMSRGIVALVFRCRPIGGSMMSEAFAVRILDAYHYDAVPAIRDHDGVRLVVPAAN